MQSGYTSAQSGFTLLSELSDSDLDWFFSAGKRERPAPQTVIVKEGGQGEFIYFVLEGLLGVYTASLGDREIARLGPGQIFGEMSYLEDRPASATVKTLEESHLLAIRREDLEAKLGVDSALGARLFKSLAITSARRLRETMGTLSRWMEVEDRLPVDGAVLQRWRVIAEKTQAFKELIVKADKAAPEQAEEAAARVKAELAPYCEFMNAAIGEKSPETVSDREELGARIQRELTPYFLKSQTVESLYRKPRGYIGDFTTLGRILENKPAGSGRVGPVLDEAFLRLPVCEAIRQRRKMLSETIAATAKSSNHAAKVTALGSSPSEELFDAFGQIAAPEKLRATIIDFDASALALAASRRDALGLGAQIELLATNVFDLATGHDDSGVCDQDLVYALNFTDSFGHELLRRFLNFTHRMLRPGGRVVLASFYSGNQEKAFMDYVADWKIAHRSESEINEQFAKSAYGRECSGIHFDPNRRLFLAECVK
jgi:extracellular factor (EF) 3-hydroxypalmitic acid methyl ester biosynthesis protein